MGESLKRRLAKLETAKGAADPVVVTSVLDNLRAAAWFRSERLTRTDEAHAARHAAEYVRQNIEAVRILNEMFAEGKVLLRLNGFEVPLSNDSNGTIRLPTDVACLVFH